MRSEGLLRVANLTIGYRPARSAVLEVARDLDLQLDGGELVALLGPNGSGKSTLLRTLAGLQRPLDGKVFLETRDLAELSPRERAQRLAVLFPGRIRDPNLTARQLVALGRHPHTGWWGGLGDEDLERIDSALETVDATDLANRRVVELSDGEHQKVSIARTLAQEARVVLLDEPTAFLDLPHRVELLLRLRQLTRRTGQAILLSTHDLDLALRSVDRLWLLSSGGSMAVGCPEDMVLEGSIREAFEYEGVSFDAESGAFRMQSVIRGKVRLEGRGLEFEWTRRALTRVGLAIDENELRVVVGVERGDQGLRWVLRRGVEVTHCLSIQSLLEELGMDFGDTGEDETASPGFPMTGRREE